MTMVPQAVPPAGQAPRFLGARQVAPGRDDIEVPSRTAGAWTLGARNACGPFNQHLTWRQLSEVERVALNKFCRRAPRPSWIQSRTGSGLARVCEAKRNTDW